MATELKASKKRAREQSQKLADANQLPSLAKKPSPEPKYPSASFMDLAATDQYPECGEASSEDEPPPPPTERSKGNKPSKQQTLYEGLNSVLCAYKAKTIQIG